MSGSTKAPNKYWGVRPWRRHSLVLIVAGVCYVINGITFFTAVPNGPRWASLSVARDWMPLHYWGWVWVFVGLLAIISSRWPPVADTWGYTALAALAAGWGAFYVMGFIFEDAPSANLGNASMWWLIAFLWWAIRGLDNPDEGGE